MPISEKEGDLIKKIRNSCTSIANRLAIMFHHDGEDFSWTAGSLGYNSVVRIRNMKS